MTAKIPIVDDEAGMLQTLTRILSRKGYDVYPAGSGQEDCKAIEETVFDLVIKHD